MRVQDLIRKVILGIDKEWSIDTIIRFVYTECGKEMSKNTDFFFSLNNKLENQNLSYEEIEEIYNDDKKNGDLEVICKSSCHILKQIYDLLGFKSRLIKIKSFSSTNTVDGKEIEIAHWVLVVEGEKGPYVLSLASDLANIKYGFKTKHFSVSLPKFKETPSGQIVEQYDEDEINPVLLSDDYLRTLDMETGYLKEYYKINDENRVTEDWELQYGNSGLSILKSALLYNRLYFDELIYNSDFYQSLTTFKGKDGKTISFNETKKEDITVEDWDIWIKLLSCKVFDKLIETFGFYIKTTKKPFDDDWDYEEWLKEICGYIQGYILTCLGSDNYQNLMLDDDWKYGKWSREIKKTSKDLKAHENPLLILDEFNAMVNKVNEIKLNIDKPKDEKKKEKNIITPLLKELSLQFVNYDQVLGAKRYVPTEYLRNKFKVLFTRIFECNQKPTYFNGLEYSEQIAIVKEVLDLMFPELSKSNSSNIPTYDDKFSPTNNRVHLYPIKHRTNGQYSLVIGIIGPSSKESFYYFYDLKTNQFRVANLLAIKANYVIVSKRLKKQIEDLYTGFRK